MLSFYNGLNLNNLKTLYI